MSRNGKGFDYPRSNKSVGDVAYRAQRYGHDVGTIGELAHKMHMRPATMIQLFAAAGVKGLHPNYVIGEMDWKSVTEFFNRLKKSEAKTIYKDTEPLESRIVLVQDINIRLLKDLAKQPRLIHELDPRKFELLVARILEDQGCEVSLTPRTRDGGYDIFGRVSAGPANLVFLAECKQYAPDRKVGVEVVRGLYGVTEIHKANLGLVITSSSFTKDARAEKVRIGDRIDLKDYSDLCNWLSAYRAGG